MPFLIVHTNAKLKNTDTGEFVQAASELVAAELHKPIGYIVVTLDQNKNMAFGGSSENTGILAEMKSIGFNNKASLAKLLTEFFFDRFEVDLHNINIEFVDMPASTVAIGGSLLG